MILAPSDVAAHAAQVQPGTLRQWVRRGVIPAPVDGLYDLQAIHEWANRRSHRHAVAARHQRNTHRDRCGKPPDV